MLTTFEFLDLKPRNPYFSLALDEALCQYVSKMPDFTGGIRLWGNPYSIILGRTCDPNKNLNESYLEKFIISHKKSHWSSHPQLCRRSSGGGTVLHGPGNINYTIIIPLVKFPQFYELRRSYDILMGMVQNSLADQGIATKIEGKSDLVMPGENGEYLKISGNAQFRKYGMIVHHGTLITRKEIIEQIDRYLEHPPREPEYRAGRVHRQFLGHLPDSFDLSAFYSCLSDQVLVHLKNPLENLPAEDKQRIFSLARKLTYENYAKREWIMTGRLASLAGVSER